MSKKKKKDLEEQDSAIQETPNEEVPAEDGGKEPCPSGENEFDVSPKIEAEYLVVMLDCKLKDHQDAGEDKILTDPVYIEFSIKQKEGTPKFDKGAKLEITGDGEIELYKEKELTTKVDSATPFTNEEMMGEEKLKLWAFGKKAGKCTFKLTVEDTEIEELTIADPLEIEIGVIELKMKVHEHDKTKLGKLEVNPNTDPVSDYHTELKDLDLPDQIEITDENKVKKGRLLHEQNNKSFGPAKLILSKLDASHIPDGCDEYDIVFNETNTSGAVEICDAEFDGNIQAFPFKIKLKDVKAADKAYWVQGKTATKKWREVRVDCGLDRAEGGLAKTEKRNGDWARYTVVKIKEVKVDYTAPVDKADAWDTTNHRFYINFDDDPDGRKVTIKAELSEKLEGVKIHLMLAEDENNRLTANWGKDMPANWKWNDVKDSVKHKDKADRASETDPMELLHLSETTDVNGIAKKELALSRFGGDIFWPGCYIDEDPHIAKYIRGHADLKKRKPILAANSITVYRKFWYQPIDVEGVANPGAAGAVTKYRNAKADMVAAGTVNVTRATVDAMASPAIYPEYMIRVGGGDDDKLLVSDLNKAGFFTDAALNDEDDKPVKIAFIICDAQWDSDGNSSAKSSPYALSTAFPIEIETDKLICKPPVQGGDLYVSGTWKSQKKVGGSWVNDKNENFSNADITIKKTRNSLYKISVKLPAGVGAKSADKRVKIMNLVVKGSNPDGPYLGEYSTATKRILTVYEPADAADFQNTVAHEFGHAFKQTANGAAEGEPGHTNQYESAGSHCNYNADKCLMYESGPIVGTLGEYCPVCHPYVLMEDFSELA